MNFSMTELIKSDTAVKNKINNIPQQSYILDNLMNLIVYCLQPIRDYIKKPMIITSGYRNERVNALVKGKSNSQHLKGEAVDFHITGLSINQIIELVKKSGVEYDQLINEYDEWVHISYSKGKNKKQPPFKIS